MTGLEAALSETPPGIIDEISPDEEMYWPGREEAYFAAGRSALRAIRLAELAAGTGSPARILDLPCGHGRVLRMLKAAYPEAELTACDLNREGVDFCARVFGAKPVYSTLRAEEVPLDETFDLIWSGSLVTHLDLDRWRAFFALYERCLAPGGLLVLTTFGRWPAERLRRREFTYAMTDAEIPGLLEAFDREGFAYSDYPGATLSGMSLTAPSWVVRHVEERSELRLVSYTERGWNDHQDVVACQSPRA
jgi:SAM-dependent methyltransferase